MNSTEVRELRPIIGTEEASIDDKGRVLVSKKKRERLGDPFVLTVGMLGCLVAYPQEVFDRRYNEIFQGSAINHDREDYQRMALGLADDDIKFDVQGRFVVPMRLRVLAQLKERLLLVGCGDSMEIWDPVEFALWEKAKSEYKFDRREEFTRAHCQATGRIQL